METELFFGPKFEENTSQTANSARYTETCPLRMCWFPQLKDWGRVGSSTKEVFFSCRKFIGLAEKLKSNKLFVFFFPGRTINVPVFPGFSSEFRTAFAQHRPGASDPSLQIKIIDFSMASTARIFRRPDSDSVESVESVESCYLLPSGPRVLGQELH